MTKDRDAGHSSLCEETFDPGKAALQISPYGAQIRDLERRFPGKPYCLVKHWTIFRAVLTEEELAKVEKAGHQPLFMMADEVLVDSKGRFVPGNWVRSSMCISLHDGVMFETRNTVYFLVGPGSEQTATLSTIFSFY